MAVCLLAVAGLVLGASLGLLVWPLAWALVVQLK